MVRLLCPITTLALACSFGAAEAAVLRGRVVDGETGEGLPGAAVVVSGAPAVAADDGGWFVVGGLPAGPHHVSVTRLGYTPLDRAPVTVTEAAEPVRLALHRQPIVFEELVVSAPRAAPGPGRSILGQQLEEAAPRDVGEYLRTVPGLGAVRRGGGALDLVYRGFRSEQLEVQIDGGAHVYGACPSRMDPPTSHVQAEDLEKIEVLSGPHALRYGPAFGGLVNLAMARPPELRELALHTRLEAGYESNGGGRRARLSALGGDRLYDFYLGAGTKAYGDYEDGDGSRVPSGSEVWDYSLKLGYKPSPGERLQLSVRQSFVRDALYPSLPMDLDVDDTGLLTLDYARPLGIGPADHLTAKVYLSTVDHTMSNRRKPTSAQMLAETEVETRTAGGRLEVGAALLGGQAHAGADYRDLAMDGQRLRRMGGRAMRDIIWPHAHHRQAGVFAQLERPVGASALSAGARLDQVSSSAGTPEPSFTLVAGSDLERTDLNPSATVGLVRDLGHELEARLFAGLAQRSPTVAERYLYLLPVGLDRYDYLGAPDLAPERNLQLDAALRLHRRQLDVSVSAYASQVSDYIAARLDTNVAPRSPGVLGVRRFANVSRARLAGLEAEGQVALRPDLRGSVTLAYLRGQDLDLHQPLPEVPPASALLSLRHTHGSGRYWLEVSQRLVAAQGRVSAEYGEVESSAFAVLGLAGAVRLTPHLELRSSAANLLDATYREHLNRRQTADGLPIAEPGRSLQVRLIARN
ncbi:MAG: TonB-dependent receptor [Gemmatimonadota bacterium]